MKYFGSVLLLLLLSLGAMAVTPIDNVTLSGTVTDKVDGEPLIGVTLYIPELKSTTITDVNGHYAFDRLPRKTVTLQVSYVGHQTIIEEVNLATTRQRDFIMLESNALINEVVVTGVAGSQLLKDSPTPVAILTLRDLQTTSSTNIIDAIARRPGLAQLTTGSGISKPVIRGLGYNRVVTVADGIRQEGQQWGDEHGIELDAQRVNSIEILKGPASLMYGSDAMAGVVVFHHRPALPAGQVRGSATTEYQTNNGLAAWSLNMGGNHHGTVWDMRYSEKMAHTYKNKADGHVSGTQFGERALSALAGLNRRWGYSHLLLSHYHLTPTMTEVEEEEEGGEDEPHFSTKSYKHGLPYQQIHHYKVVSDNSVYVGDGTLKLLVGYQNNRRQEFEELPGEAGLDFMLHTLTYDMRYAWQNEGGLKLHGGVGGMWQRSLNKGEEYLIPAYALCDVGAYATAGYKVGGWTLSGGMRMDHRHVHAFELPGRFSRLSRNFDALTGSLGAVKRLGESMTLKVNIARGFRAPNLSELGSNGEHEGTFRYEVGNGALHPEYSWQADAGWDYNSPVVSAQLALFVNIIDNYIFARRDGATTDGVPRYVFTQGDARLMGGEATIDFHPVERLHFENSFSFVDARQLHQPADRKYLPRTPAPRWVSELSYDIVRDGKTLNNTFVKIGMECYLRQNHAYTADDTERLTPSYTLLNFTASTEILRNHRNICTLSLNIDNLTDRAYQSHLSRLKYAGEKGFCNMGRNFSIKAAFPVIIK